MGWAGSDERVASNRLNNYRPSEAWGKIYLPKFAPKFILTSMDLQGNWQSHNIAVIPSW